MKIRFCVLRIVAMLAMITGQGIAVAGPKGLGNDVELIRLAGSVKGAQNHLVEMPLIQEIGFLDDDELDS